MKVNSMKFLVDHTWMDEIQSSHPEEADCNSCNVS